MNTTIGASMGAHPDRNSRRKPRMRTGILAACLMAISFVGPQPATASNDSYCGHGSSGIFLHNWFLERWYNEFWDHSPPPGRDGHWNHYQKWYQPNYYPGAGLGWLWFDGGQIYKTGSGCI